MNEYHLPVLPEMVARYLITRHDGVYVDGTVGFGGHAEYLLRLLSKNARYIAIDQDGEALHLAQQRLVEFKNTCFYHHNFSAMQQIVADEKIDHVHGIFLDLGVSSYQINSAARGFSYRADGPLDMRMGEMQQRTAADIINGDSVEQLIEIFRCYGEERRAAPIAREIEKRRRFKRITTTGVLSELVSRVVPGAGRIKSCARIFQAIRIAVNGELEHLKRGLEAGFSLLAKGGRLVIISYHSLEDRMVKQFFIQKAKACSCPPDLPTCVCQKKAEFKILTRKVVRPSAHEISNNPRARSAKLRAGERL
jgi:16S rRNA (cytosine1402-N4)-methyltransferase